MKTSKLVLAVAFGLPVTSFAQTPEVLFSRGAASFAQPSRALHDARPDIPAVGEAASVAPPLTPAARLSTPWLQEWFERALQAKAAANPRGLCRGAQALYSFEGGRRPGTEEQWVMVMEAAKRTMGEYIAKNYPDGETELKIITAGPINVGRPGEVGKWIGRVLEDDWLKSAILTHAGEFARPAKRALIRSDAIYTHQKPDEPLRVSQLRFAAFVDLEQRELSLIGAGECEF